MTRRSLGTNTHTYMNVEREVDSRNESVCSASGENPSERLIGQNARQKGNRQDEQKPSIPLRERSRDGDFEEDST